MSRSKSELETYADEVWDRFEKLKKFEEYDKIKAENENFAKASRELSAANETLRLENDCLKERLEDVESERNRLSGEVLKLQTNLEEALGKRHEVEREINQLKPKVEDLEKKLRGTRGELKRLGSSQAFTRFVVDPDQLSKEELRPLVETIKRDLLRPLEDGYRGRLRDELIVEAIRRAAGPIKKIIEYLGSAGAAHPNYACPQCRSTPGFDSEGALICTKCSLKWFIACPKCRGKMKYIAQHKALHCTSCMLTWK